GVEAAVPVDPRVRADRQAAAAQLAGPVEPHVAAEVNRRSPGELDPENTAVPGVPEPEARNVGHEVVRQVVERADEKKLEGAGPRGRLERARRARLAQIPVKRGHPDSIRP